MASRKQELSDESLLIAIGHGDRVAVTQLYQRHGGRLHHLALGVTRNAALADEALQEAFVAIWKTASSYDKRRGTAIGWIIRVVRFKAIDLVRDQVRQNDKADQLALEPGETSEAPVAEANILGQQEQKQLSACLKGLAPDRRQLIEAAFLRGLTHKQLADAAQQPLGSIKSNIRRGLTSLRDCLESYSDPSLAA